MHYVGDMHFLSLIAPIFNPLSTKGGGAKGDGRKKIRRVILGGFCLNDSKSGSNGLRDFCWVRGHMKSRLGSTFDTSFAQWQA